MKSGAPLFRSLAEVSRDDAPFVGSKAGTLGELRRRGLPVPDGFVVTTVALERFLRATGLDALVRARLAELRGAPDGAAERVSRELREAIASQPLPDDLAGPIDALLRRLRARSLAVRSSAPFEDGRDQSWAGQFDSFLGVSPGRVGESVRQCWASLFTARALAYRSTDDGERASMAVLVQSMVPADRAGVAFSTHPVTGVTSQIVVEAVYGLGESLVSGQVTPDTFTLDKRSLRLVARAPHLQTQARRASDDGVAQVSLSTAERRRGTLDAAGLRRLGRLVVEVERRFGAPVDVEWALSRGQPRLLQCRPITAAPLAASAVDRSSLTEDAMRAMEWRYIHTRTRSPFFAHAFMGGIPEYLNDIGLDYRVRHIGIFLGDVAMNRPDWDALARRVLALRAADPGWPLRAIRLCHEQHAAARARWRRLLARDWSTSSPAALARGLESYVDDCLRFNAFVVWPPVMEADLTREVQERLRARFGDAWTAAFAVASDPVEAGVVLDEQLALLRIAERLGRGHDVGGALEAHARRFGWMKNVGYFGDWFGAAHYAQLARRAAKSARASLAETRAGIASKRRAFARLLRATSDDASLQSLLRTTNAAVAFRSYRTEMFYESYRYARPLLAAIARRVGLSSRGVLQLFPDEILALVRSEKRAARDLVRERERGYIWVSDRAGTYFTLAGAEAERAHPVFLGDGAPSSRTELVGQAAFPGVVRGRAVVVRTSAELASIRAGDVLVAHATNIDYVHVLRKVAAIVTEEGGILCHAAVVSREMRIPAVIGTGDATRVLATGDQLEVDGARGLVRRV